MAPFTFPRGRYLAALLPALMLLALALPAPRPARAVEFTAPPGMDVARQEEMLRDKVRQIATDLVGDKLVDVVVNVGYARTETRSARTQGQRVKLPGFNRFITPSDQNGVEINPEFVRLRQVFVFVSNDLDSDVKNIQREVEELGGFDRRKGDTVQVVAVSAKGGQSPGEMLAGKGQGGEGQGEGKPRMRPRKKRSGDPFSEPESTAHLLRARTAYFNEDYNRALDQILKAISIEPENSQAYAMLGSLYYTINWKNLALKYWERSLEIDPDNREVEELVAELRSR